MWRQTAVVVLCLSLLAEGRPSLNLQPIVVNPGGIGGLYKGPDSETIIKGPDGSQITSAQKGGIVAVEPDLQPIVVADIEPQIGLQAAAVPVNDLVAPQPISVAQPISVVPQTVVLPQQTVLDVEDPHIIETELVDAPDVEPDQKSDLIGPSGRISTDGSRSVVSGPASTTISEPVKFIKTAVVLPSTPIVAPNVVLKQAAPELAVQQNLAVLSNEIQGSTALSVDISGHNLGGLSTALPPLVHQAQLDQAQLNHVQLNQELNQAQLNQAQLNQARLNQEINQAQLNQAQLNQVQLNQELNQAQLNQAQLNQAQLNQDQLNQVHVSQAQLNQAQLNQAQLNQELNQAQLNQAQLNQAQLNQAHVSQAQLNQELNQAQLNQAQLNRGQLNQAQLNQAQLNQVHLNQAQLDQSQLNQLTNAQVQGLQAGQPILLSENVVSSTLSPHLNLQGQQVLRDSVPIEEPNPQLAAAHIPLGNIVPPELSLKSLALQGEVQIQADGSIGLNVKTPYGLPVGSTLLQAGSIGDQSIAQSRGNPHVVNQIALNQPGAQQLNTLGTNPNFTGSTRLNFVPEIPVVAGPQPGGVLGPRARGLVGDGVWNRYGKRETAKS